jgi:hypothetical protein
VGGVGTNPHGGQISEFLWDFFEALDAAGIGEETVATYSDFFTGDPAVR